jgi:hypothetical protein
MIDWFVLLTPLLALAVVLLLGFAGCKFEPRVASPPAPELTLRVRVPTAFTVLQSQFRWTRPGSTVLEETIGPLDVTDDGSGTSVHSHEVGENPELGTWQVTCRMQVRDATRQDAASVDATFVLDEGTPGGQAIFTTRGSPGTNDFAIDFLPGLVPEE